MNFIRVTCSLLLVIFTAPFLHADALDDLARDFWAWRTVEQPISSDDIPRLDRPLGWLPNWSAEAVAGYRQQLSEFESRWKNLNASSWPMRAHCAERRYSHTSCG